MAHSIVITGGAGFVARHLITLLADVEAGSRVHAWHRGASPPSFPVHPSGRSIQLTWRTVDVLDRTGVRHALAHAAPAEVYHLAGAPHVGHSWRDPAGVLDTNVLGTHILLDELRDLRIDARVLLPSSATVYAPSEAALTESSTLAPASPYALSKLVQEMLGARAVNDDGQSVLLARAFNHLGPGQDPSFFAPAFARQLVEIERGVAPPVLRVGNLDARRDLTDVRDTVRAYHAMMKRGKAGRPYNVCCGKAWAIRQILDALIQRCQVRVSVEVDPARLRPNDLPTVLGSYARLHEETGWAPRIALEQTLTDLIDEARLGASLV